MKKFKVDKTHKIECPNCNKMSPEVAVTKYGESTHYCSDCGKFKIMHDGDIVWTTTYKMFRGD